MEREIPLHKSREKPVKWVTIKPAQMLALGFLALIALGTMLLMLPMATKDRHQLSFIDALFEATSAVCVTGLVVVDTHTTFTMFGQIVLMVLIQVGGLGFMTTGVFIAILLGKNIGLKNRIMIQESLNQLSLSGLVRLVKFIVAFTLIVEGIGTVVLGVYWSDEMGWAQAFYYGLFHSVSAFNNAGFDLMGGFSSLTGFVGDTTIMLTISSLFIIGGIGFTVMLDVTGAAHILTA
jgi:trk system potassium uptake protein TrkH